MAKFQSFTQFPVDYIIIIRWKFFTAALGDGVSLESKRREISSSLLDYHQ